MGETDFINKTQFTILFEHFKNFVASLTKEDINKKVISEFNYLLDKFRHVFQDSERKTSKIYQLSAEKNNIENDMKSLIQEQSSAVSKLEEEVRNLNKQIEYYCDERNKSVHEIENLKLERLSFVTSESMLIPETEDVETQTQVVLYPDLLPEERTEKSEFSAPHSDYILKRNLNNKREKYSKSVLKKIKVLETEVKFRRKDILDLKKELKKEQLALDECCFALTNMKQQKVNLENNLCESRKSYESKLHTLSEKFNATKTKQRNLEEKMKDLKEERNSLSLKVQKREKDLEEACSKLVFIMEKDNHAKKKAEMFEAQLASNHNSWANMMDEMKKLREVKQKFKKDESSGKTTKQKPVVLQDKSSSDKNERQRLAEHFKSQLMVRDKEITNLKEETDEKNHKLISLKKELTKICRANTNLSEELSQSKKAAHTLTETVQGLRSSLKEAEKTSTRLQDEIKSQKFQCHTYLEERNKWRKMFEKVTAVKAQREFERRVLIKSQHTLMNTLKIKDDKVRKLLIIRRQRWIRK